MDVAFLALSEEENAVDPRKPSRRHLLHHADSLRICDLGFRFDDHEFLKQQVATAGDTGFAIESESSQYILIEDD